MSEELSEGKTSNVRSNVQKRTTIVLWVSSGMVALLVFALPTVFLFFFGMLPTFVAYIVDRNKDKYATFCVASMNFCGVFPYLMDLWINGHTITAATNIMTDVFALVIIYGAAACGWVIYSSLPPIVSSLLGAIEQRRIAALRGQQRKLILEWGVPVSGEFITETLSKEDESPPAEENINKSENSVRIEERPKDKESSKSSVQANAG